MLSSPDPATVSHTAAGGDAAIWPALPSAQRSAADTSAEAEFYFSANQPLGKPTLGTPEASGKATNSYIPKSSRASSWPETENKYYLKTRRLNLLLLFSSPCKTYLYCLLQVVCVSNQFPNPYSRMGTQQCWKSLLLKLRIETEWGQVFLKPDVGTAYSVFK